MELIEFTKFINTIGYDKNTIKGILRIVNRFINYLPKTDKNIFTAEKQDIMAFYEDLKNRPSQNKTGGLSSSYIYTHFSVLKKFYKYLEEYHYHYKNPMHKIKIYHKIERKERIILTQTEIKKLYQQTENIKDIALLGVYYGCGLRKTEGENLNLSDINLQSGFLQVIEGKNKLNRAVPLSYRLIKDFSDYLRFYRKRQKTDCKALLLNNSNNKLKGEFANKRLKYLLSKTDIKKPISLHNLRHSIATHLLENGLEIEKVQYFLGHLCLESTQIYIHQK